MSLASIGIVAHHTRYDRATRLGDVIGADVVMVDEGGWGAGRNHERCYEWLADATTGWAVLLEDDAMPVRGFRAQLDAVLQACPDKVSLLSLYLGRTRPLHWQPSIAQVITTDHHFLLCNELLHHVAVAVRTRHIPALLHHIRTETRYRNGKLPIDEAVGAWARTLGPIGYCHPSIVDHDHTLDTAIQLHVSGHRGETGRRRAGELRKAWAFGSRKRWAPHVATIPAPAV